MMLTLFVISKTKTKLALKWVRDWHFFILKYNKMKLAIVLATIKDPCKTKSPTLKNNVIKIANCANIVNYNIAKIYHTEVT